MTQPPSKRSGNPAVRAAAEEAGKRPAAGKTLKPRRRGLPQLTPGRKRIVALVLLVAVVASVVIVGIAYGGLGPETLPAPTDKTDPVAEVDGVDDGVVTLAQFDAALLRVSTQQGLEKPPKPGDPSYDTILQQAMQDQLLPIWAQGEAEERGITPTDQELQDRLKQIVSQGFKSDDQFTQFVVKQGYCTKEELAAGKEANKDDPLAATLSCVGVRREVGFQLIASKLQEQLGPSDPKAATAAVPSDEVELFYQQNIDQYKVPETRDVRIILNKDADQVQKAYDMLSKDDSTKTWEQVAKQYSSDPASKTNGGLLQGIAEGQSPGGPQFDAQAFSAQQGEVVKPFKTDTGTYLLEVDKIHPEQVTPLSQVEQSIRTQLASTEQQNKAQEFEQDFFAQWSQRTACAEGYQTSDCENAPKPNPCTPALAQAKQCPSQLGQAPVGSTKPAEPGQAGLVAGTTAALAQGPRQPPPPAQPGVPGLPGGTIPLGPGGAPPTGTVPPGTVPPGTVPPTTAPPTGAPPTAAPPTAAPPTGGTPVPPSP